jgi:hypothetical protein
MNQSLNSAAAGTVLISAVATSKEGQRVMTKHQECLDFFCDGVVHYELTSCSVSHMCSKIYIKCLLKASCSLIYQRLVHHGNSCLTLLCPVIHNQEQWQWFLPPAPLDLAPWNLFLFPVMKLKLREKRFNSVLNM